MRVQLEIGRDFHQARQKIHLATMRCILVDKMNYNHKVGYNDKVSETHPLLAKINDNIAALGTYGQYNISRSVVKVVPKEYVKQVGH